MILEEHHKFRDSGGKQGQRADLSQLDLRGHSLRGADLRQAILQGTDLSHTDLRQADLTGADLRSARLVKADITAARLNHADLRDASLHQVRGRRADFAHADLRNADLSEAQFQGAEFPRAKLAQADFRRTVLRDTNLTDADLTDARNLLPVQFGGALLSGAKLPGAIAFNEGLGNVAEASKTTQNLFTSILFVCAYAWLTVASTSDPQLLNNAAPASSRLPILGTDIPLPRFFAVAPLLLLCMYIYQHLGLQRLWEELSELPAAFPDGRQLDKKSYPWLLNALVRAHTPRLRDHRSHLSRWQARISVLLAWGLVPGTVFLMWARYLRGQDWICTSLHVMLLAAAIGVGSGFGRLAASTLRGAELKKFLWNRAWKDARAHSGLVALLAASIFGILSYGAIEGVNPAMAAYKVPMPESTGWAALNPKFWVPQLFMLVGYCPFAQLDDAVISIKPPNWTVTRKEPDGPTESGRPAEIAAVRGADLAGRKLRYASAYNVFLVKAYLKHADLQRSDLRAADLRAADLRDANLFGANLRDANLNEAVLRRADLGKARLFATHLNQTDFTSANLRDASLEEALIDATRFSGANLSGAILKSLDLRSAIFTKTESVPAARLAGADLSSALLQGADLAGVDLSGARLEGARLGRRSDLPAQSPSASDALELERSLDPADRGRTRLEGAILNQAILDRADLSDADLRGADLRNASLKGTNLRGAILVGADLRGADLSTTTGLEQADLQGIISDAATNWPRSWPDSQPRISAQPPNPRL